MSSTENTHTVLLLDQVITLVREDINAFAVSIRRKSIIKLSVVSVLIFLVILIVIFLTWSIIRDIGGALKKLNAFAQHLMKKDLTKNLVVANRGDEFGDLENSYASVGKTLFTIITNLQHEIDTIGHSSAEIINTITALAGGQKETESAVLETNAVLEELRQSSEVATGKAASVLTYANETIETLSTSSKTIYETIDDLNQMQEKMGIISESTTKLNEHCQAIGGIIDTVHDLAEQSHVLAVNASIEAAKAGEHGKGFAVVALEVRNLAEQSQQATKQVHNILTDIQNAMNTTVLATEQGSISVKQGVEKSSNTTNVMSHLSANIEKVVVAAKEISATADQQLSAVSQSSEAMNNIREATSHHTEQTTQIEQSITDLHMVSEKLNFLIAEFSLPSDANKRDA